MLDKKNENTSFGQLLISAGIINLIPRIYLPLDIFISIIIISKGAASIKAKNWGYEEFFNKFVLCLVGFYTIFKGFIIYFFLPDYIYKTTNQEISGEKLLLSSIIFLSLTMIIIVLAYLNLMKVLKGKTKKQTGIKNG